MSVSLGGQCIDKDIVAGLSQGLGIGSVMRWCMVFVSILSSGKSVLGILRPFESRSGLGDGLG